MLDESQGQDDFVFTAPDTPQLKHVLKRAFDVSISAALLLMLAPLFALLAILVWMQGGGNVIYSHTRVGRDGDKFGCLKFRTMVPDADIRLAEILCDDHLSRREWNETRKLKNDPRILPGVGEMLRKTSLDELPQIWNVLRGDMSLVGPRPVTEDELDRYGPARMLYLSVRPGLTGPWQIGERSNGTYDSRIVQDTDYIRHWTLSQDIAIIAKTALMVLRGHSPGAY